MKNLKPCPFCGGEMTIVRSPETRSFIISHRNLRNCHFYRFRINWQTANTLEEAVLAWNRRTTDYDY